MNELLTVSVVSLLLLLLCCCLQTCEHHGMLKAQELSNVVAAHSNAAVLQHLAQHYSIPLPSDATDSCNKQELQAVHLLGGSLQ